MLKSGPRSAAALVPSGHNGKDHTQSKLPEICLLFLWVVSIRVTLVFVETFLQIFHFLCPDRLSCSSLFCLLFIIYICRKSRNFQVQWIEIWQYANFSESDSRGTGEAPSFLGSILIKHFRLKYCCFSTVALQRSSQIVWMNCQRMARSAPSLTSFIFFNSGLWLAFEMDDAYCHRNPATICYLQKNSEFQTEIFSIWKFKFSICFKVWRIHRRRKFA